MRRVALLFVVLALLSIPAGGASEALAFDETTSSPDPPAIVAVYPNPVAADDTGEFVVLSVPPETDLGSFTLADGEATVELPNVTATGRVTLSTNATATRKILDRQVFPLSADLRLANGGESLSLRRADRVIDTVRYGGASEGDVLELDGERRWRPIGTTDRTVTTAGPSTVRAFVLPDSPATPFQTLADAEDRILLAGYTFTSGRVADHLVDAVSRNVTVRVLVDDSPVGGLSRRQAHVLDRLAREGVEVTTLGSDHARFAFHHAKYAVVDDRALVTTENWKPAGVGGNASRGWGVITPQAPVVRNLAETFRADATALDARPWEAVRTGRSYQPAKSPPANASYPTRFDQRTVFADRTRLLVAPDNAETTLLGVIENASESLRVQQVSLGSLRQPLVCATVDAARRGVNVQILLSSAWYVREENRRLADRLTRLAARENLPLRARLADPRGRYEKIHAKGAIIDRERVILGSINWNNNSLRRNREVTVVLTGQGVADYYGEVFEADWLGGIQRLPAGVLVAVAAGCLAALARARQIEFGGFDAGD